MDDMNQEQGGVPEEVQRPQSQPRFEPVTAGGPSFAPEAAAPQENVIISNQYDASLGGRAQGRKKSSGTPPFSGQTGGERKPGHGLRNALLIGGGTVAGVAAAATAFLGLGRLGSSNPNPDTDTNNGAATLVVPDSHTHTPEATKEPTKVEKSPYEFGFSKKVGDVTVQITKQTQERTECPDPSAPIKSAQMVPCSPTHEITVNKDIFPDAEERTKKVFELGIYYAWQRADLSRKDVTFEEYMQRTSGGEDMSIKARGFQGSSFLPTDITISPTDEFYFDVLHEPISIIRPWTSFGAGYREIINPQGGREFHIEVFDFTAMGVGQKNQTIVNWGPTEDLVNALSFLSFPDLQKAGTFLSQAQIDKLAPVVVPLRNTVFTRVNNIPWGTMGAK